VPAQQSGINIRGAVRDNVVLKVGKKNLLLIAKNKDKIQVLQF
jgi:hypothetical protein